VSNVGSLPVENLEIWTDWHPDERAETAAALAPHPTPDLSPIEWDVSLLESHLPLLPADSFVLPMHFFVSPGTYVRSIAMDEISNIAISHRGKVRLQYGGDHYRRSAIVEINIHSEEVLRLVGLNAHVYSNPSRCSFRLFFSPPSLMW